MLGPTGTKTESDCAPRSRLFNVEPQAGHYGVESLTSYVGRLARKHYISMSSMIHDVLIPALDKTYLNTMRDGGGTKFLAQSGSLNGIGDGATTLVQTVQNLTHRSDLYRLTLLPFKHLISDRGLIKHHRAWCSACLQEMNDSQMDVYEPLIWILQVVQVCSLHQQTLEQLCPCCHRTLFWWERYASPGYCKCGGYLGVRATVAMQCSVEEFKRQIYYTSTLNTLTYLAFGNAELVKQISVKEYIQTLTSVLKISRADLSRKLNIPKNTLHGWYHETNRIPLPVLLDICYSAHQKLVFTPKFNPKDHNRQCLSTSKIQTRLQASLSQCPPPSLRALASELRIDRRLLSRKFPELARQIALRFQIYVTEKRKERLSRLALDIKRAIVAVRSDGKSPTQRNVEEYLRKPGLLREKCLKEIWSKERAIVPRFGSGGKKKF